MRGTHWGGKGTIGLQAAVPKWPHTRPLTLTFNFKRVTKFHTHTKQQEKLHLYIFSSFVFLESKLEGKKILRRGVNSIPFSLMWS